MKIVFIVFSFLAFSFFFAPCVAALSMTTTPTKMTLEVPFFLSAEFDRTSSLRISVTQDDWSVHGQIKLDDDYPDEDASVWSDFYYSSSFLGHGDSVGGDSDRGLSWYRYVRYGEAATSDWKWSGGELLVVDHHGTPDVYWHTLRVDSFTRDSSNWYVSGS